jgi:peroxiredoxin Q/BCP
MTHLQIGDPAPDFRGFDQDGNEISLSDYRGKKLVLYFYPKDDTPGCTNEACNLRDNIEPLKKAGFEVLGVSPDKSAKHRKFIDKYELPFPLLADTEKEVLQAYGVWGPKKFMGKEYIGVHRMTFLIDENGVISYIFKKVKTKIHAEEILESIEAS